MPTSCSSATTTSTSGSPCSGRRGDADPTNGIRYITVGTGGASHHSVGTIKPTSQVARRRDVGASCASCCTRPVTTGEFFPVAGFSFTDSGSTSIAGTNSAPSATVLLTPGSAVTNTVLTATATKSDPDADPVSLTWEWRVNGTLRRTFTSPTALTDTFDLSQAGNGDAGDTINVTVTPSDATHNGTPASATLTSARRTTAPVFTTDLTDLTVAEGGTVTASTQGDRRRWRHARLLRDGLPAASRSTRHGLDHGLLGFSEAGIYSVSVSVSDGSLADTDTFQ